MYRLTASPQALSQQQWCPYPGLHLSPSLLRTVWQGWLYCQGSCLLRLSWNLTLSAQRPWRRVVASVHKAIFKARVVKYWREQCADKETSIQWKTLARAELCILISLFLGLGKCLNAFLLYNHEKKSAASQLKTVKKCITYTHTLYNPSHMLCWINSSNTQVYYALLGFSFFPLIWNSPISVTDSEVLWKQTQHCSKPVWERSSQVESKKSSVSTEQNISVKSKASIAWLTVLLPASVMSAEMCSRALRGSFTHAIKRQLISSIVTWLQTSLTKRDLFNAALCRNKLNTNSSQK